MVSEILVIIGLGNGLSPVQCQAITWNIADLLISGCLEMKFSEIVFKLHKFSPRNAFQNVIYKILSIFPRAREIMHA